MNAHKDSVVEEIASLYQKTLPELRKIWGKYFPSEPPPYYRKHLIDKIAYRLQEMSYGKLPNEVERKLNDLANKVEQGKKISSDKLPIAGTKLTREYNGKDYEVMVTDMGFTYQGQFFTSLSAIAEKITGTNWNGPSFFGLRDKKRNEIKEQKSV